MTTRIKDVYILTLFKCIHCNNEIENLHIRYHPYSESSATLDNKYNKVTCPICHKDNFLAGKAVRKNVINEYLYDVACVYTQEYVEKTLLEKVKESLVSRLRNLRPTKKNTALYNQLKEDLYKVDNNKYDVLTPAFVYDITKEEQ